MAKKARVYDGTAWQELASAQTDLSAYSTTAQISSTYATQANFPADPWISFTPTWSGLTIGNGVYDYSKYQIIGKTAFVNIRFVLGSTSAVTGDLILTLPANLTRNSLNGLNSTCVFGDSGTANYIGIIAQSGASSTQWFVRPINASASWALLGACSATTPHTWAVNDSITFNVSYEVA